MNKKLTPNGECMNDVEERIKSYILDINEKFKSKTIITITHKDSVVMMIKSFKDFDYLTQKSSHTPTNGQINILYRDNTRNGQVDLHKPYIDTYRFKK